MAGNNNSSDVSQLKTEIEEALSSLDHALLDAGRSVSTVRDNMTRVLELAANARDMEAAIISAREQLALTFASGNSAPPLRAVPTQDDHDEDEPVAEPDLEPVQEPEDDASSENADEQEEDEQPEPAMEPASTATRCLRLKVSKKSGSLDLKDVDGSVNENSAVMDVALLDYDGRKATLKLWVNERADPNGVKEALLTSLRTHLGEDEIELDIEFEEHSAA
jgi:hypothetical protein